MQRLRDCRSSNKRAFQDRSRTPYPSAQIDRRLEVSLRGEMLAAIKGLQEQHHESLTKIEQELYTVQPKATEALEVNLRGGEMLAAIKGLQEQQQERLSKMDQERHILQPKLIEDLEVSLRGEMLAAIKGLQEQHHESLTKIEQELYTVQPKATRSAGGKSER